MSIGQLLLFPEPFSYNGDIIYFEGSKGYLYDPLGYSGHVLTEWTFANETDSGYLDDSLVIWSSYDIPNTANGSIFLSASDPISLDGYNLIEWDGDTTGLERLNNDYYFITSIDEMAFDAFTVMELLYANNPVVLTGFNTVGDNAWYVVPPTSAYYYSAAAEFHEGSYGVVALKFDDIDDTGYTKMIAYRSIESPPDEGGGDDDDPQPPFGG